jgi:hypothetical protein
MSNSVDTWEKFSLTVTNSSGSDSNFTLTFSGQSVNAGAACYLDGVVSSPFVTWARHYGYTYNSSSITQTVNPVTILSESAAAALTGIAYSAGTLTVSQAHTVLEVYAWMQWYECSNRLAPILTSSDGISFVLAANLTLSAALTGTGSISMPGNTLMNTGSSTLSITHSAGVLTTISVAGIVSGSRVQLYDMTNAAELYNGVPGTSLTLNANWSANHTIRLRVGMLGYLPSEQTGILSSTGAQFLAAQAVDPIYLANGIDGSTVTEFTADFPHVLMDITDPDGVTTVQRIYAWLCYNQTTLDGIRTMFQAASSADASNVLLSASVVNLKLKNLNAAPVIVAGGYLARSDGATVIAADSGSIQMDPSKAYVASGLTTAAIADAVWAKVLP